MTKKSSLSGVYGRDSYTGGCSKSILMLFHDKARPLMIDEIRKEIRWSATTISGYLRELRIKGFVVSSRLPSNGRPIIWILTLAGMEYISSSGIAEWREFSDEEVAHLAEALEEQDPAS